MTKKVAVVGEVQAVPGSGLPPSAAGGSGAWTPKKVEVKEQPKLKVGGTAVIYEASCTFSFEGANSAGSAVKDSETVTLTAGTTLLQKDHDHVLRDGDTKEGKYGDTKLGLTPNKLVVTAKGKAASD